ncbi:hypothetical protein C5F59_034655 [Streptomyces sp. QL37]|uniref:hypothetical protein n=1 Tax=Streptomyces sp. QL37 TaxID=2093747 RepID=UPI000CF271C3|nr:hypothetical protein [Streptomyces sp. QL37]PPQ61331.1 hypothetical protein C5F59_35150 [Streptomyces sp. QL37]
MVRGIRNTIGLILAVLGAAAALWAPFRNWYDGRLGHDFRVWELFTGAGVTDSGAGLFASMFLPLLVAAVLTIIGVVWRSRLLVLIAGIIALGFAVLWMVRQGQAQGSLTVSGDGNGLGSGVGLALLGGVLMLIGSAVMGGRERRAERRARHERDQREHEVRDEDRDRHGVEPESPYGMAARSEPEPTAPGRGNDEEDRRTGPDSRRAPGEAAPPRPARQPQRQPSAPRGKPVPAREAGSDDAGRGDRDRTQYEEGGQAGGSHSSDDRPGRWHLRGDR